MFFVVQRGADAFGHPTHGRVRKVPNLVIFLFRIPGKGVASGWANPRRFQKSFAQWDLTAGCQVEGFGIPRNRRGKRGRPLVGPLVDSHRPIGIPGDVVPCIGPFRAFNGFKRQRGQGNAAQKGAFFVFLLLDVLHGLNAGVVPAPEVQGELFFVQQGVFGRGLGDRTVPQQQPTLVVGENQGLVGGRFVERRQLGVARLQPDFGFTGCVSAEFVLPHRGFGGIRGVDPSQMGAFGVDGQLGDLFHALVQEGPAAGGPAPDLGGSFVLAGLGLPGQQNGCFFGPNKGLHAGQGVRFGIG